MNIPFTGELVLLAILSTLIVSTAIREVYYFYQWKRQLGPVQKGEWSRLVRMFRAQ